MNKMTRKGSRLREKMIPFDDFKTWKDIDFLREVHVHRKRTNEPIIKL